jgi:hypothetical protein
LKRAFNAADLAQVHARKGEVESACDYVKQIIAIADASTPLQQRLLVVRTHLEPYADVEAVKDLDIKLRTVLLPEKP